MFLLGPLDCQCFQSDSFLFLPSLAWFPEFQIQPDSSKVSRTTCNALFGTQEIRVGTFTSAPHDCQCSQSDSFLFCLPSPGFLSSKSNQIHQNFLAQHVMIYSELIKSGRVGLRRSRPTRLTVNGIAAKLSSSPESTCMAFI